MDKSSSWSYTGHRFSSQNPHDSLQPSAKIIPRDMMTSFGIRVQEPQMWYMQKKTHIPIK